MGTNIIPTIDNKIDHKNYTKAAMNKITVASLTRDQKMMVIKKAHALLSGKK